MTFAEQQRVEFTTTGDFSRLTILSRAEEKADPRVGERVMVKSEGSWYKARIVDVDRSRSQFLIDYYGWDDSYDEWVAARQIRQPGTKQHRK